MQQKVLQTFNISFHIFLTQGFQKYEKKIHSAFFHLFYQQNGTTNLTQLAATPA